MTDIPAVVSQWPQALATVQHALITCIDSARDVAFGSDLRAVAQAFGFSSSVLGPGVVLDVAAYGNFMALPSGTVITSEGPIQSRDLPGLSTSMATSMCRLGLGDGAGLNYVTRDTALAAWLEARG